MKVTLDPKSVSGVRGRLGSTGGALRESRTRESYLDRLARMVTDVDVTVKLGDSAYSKRGKHHDYFIEIPKTETEQPVTDLSQDTWDLLFQETVEFHEIAHVLWTDFDSFETLSENSNFGAIFKEVFNALEDGCIEVFLSREYNIRDDLIVMNANLTERNKQNRQRFGPYDAICRGLMDHGFFDSGCWEDIMEGNIPVEEGDKVRQFDKRIKEDMAKAVCESDGSERINIAWDLAKDLANTFDKDTPDGQAQDGAGGVGNEDEMSSSGGGQTATPDTPDEEEIGGGDKEDEEREAEVSMDDVMGGEEDEDEDDEELDIGDIEDRVEDTHGDEASRQSEQDNQNNTKADDQASQLEHMAGIESLDGSVQIPDWCVCHTQDIEDAIRKGDSLKRILRAQLQRERSSTRKDGLKNGYLNTSDLASAVCGSSHIRYDEEQPEEKDYSCQIILDRSGSMSSYGYIRPAQRAVAQLAQGLNEVGVETSVLSFYYGETYLELPFGGDVRDYTDYIFSGRAHGGTPLADAVEMGAEELEDMGSSENKFILVVTDGEPGNTSKYQKVLDNTEVPVYGIYVNDNTHQHGSHSQYFDCVRYATRHQIDEKCRDLCKGFID